MDRAEADGVIVAHGGASLGYLLFVENGIPAFAVRDGVGVAIADGVETCLGRWVHLTGAIEGRQATLYVDGKKASSISLMHTIAKNPNESIQIGRDTGTAVDEEISGTGFQGLIRSVRVFRQAFTPDEMQAMARAKQ